MPVLDRPPRAALRASAAPPGNYVPVRRLATGRWSDLFLARAVGQDLAALPDYVLKLVRQETADRELARTLLAREAAIGTTVSHPNLISVLDHGLAADTPWLAMPYLPGKTLEQECRTELPVSMPQALWYLRQLAGALAALHAAGWLHGDVCPRNVIVSPQGHTTLIDLGLARRLNSAESQTDHWLAGSADYLAPEAFQPRRQLTVAADLYSLGILLFRLLEGTRVLSRNPGSEARAAIAELQVIRPDLGRDVATLLGRLLAHEPLRRPSATDLIEHLARLEIESLMQW